MRVGSRKFSTPKCEPVLARDARKATGVYYTPPEVVRLMVELTLGPHRSCAGSAPSILDMACGAGEFLLEAYRFQCNRYGAAAARGSVRGVDIDSEAVASARRRMCEVDRGFPETNIRVGDALEGELLSGGAFDAIVGNPPYVNIRQLAKATSPERMEWLRERYCTARGNFDLYVLFIERAIELLKPGGRCGLIVPNKWATLDYARPCRELLLSDTTIEQVIDLSGERVFAGASVYPQVLIFRKQAASAGHTILVRDFGCPASGGISQGQLSAESILLSASMDVESRVATLPLSEMATLACGTAGYSAQKIARRLVDRGDEGHADANDLADFVTSGNIDRYAIRLGRVRYLNRDYARPKLPLEIVELTSAKRRLFQAKKIVVAGMSRRLEAAWDERGLALGVQVFAASDFRVDPFYLLALLNSKLLSYLFATRYAAKRLSGGYLAVNKGQLARLPIRCVDQADSTDRRRYNRLVELAARIGGPSETEHHGGRSLQSLSHPTVAADIEIDELVYGVYRLSETEIASVEAHFAGGVARAA